MKDYLKYLLRDNRKLLLILIVLFIVIHPLVAIAQLINTPDLFAYGVSGHECITPSIIALIALVTMAMVIPIVIQQKRVQLKGVDQLYSLPISRQKLMLTELIYGWIIVFVPFIVSCVLEVVLIGFQPIKVPLELATIFIYFIVIVTGWYSFNMFITSKCNSIKDAIIVEVLYIVIFVLLLLQLNNFSYNHSISYEVANKMNDQASDFFSFIIPVSALVITNYSIKLIAVGIVYTIYTLIFTWLTIRTVKNKKVENCGDVSDSKVLYPLALMLILFILLISNSIYNQGIVEMLSFYTFLFICYIIVNFIAQRNFKIRLRHLLLFVVSICLSYLFTYAYTQTGCFYLAYEYKDIENVKRVYITYHELNEKEEIFTKLDKYYVIGEEESLLNMMEVADKLQSDLVSDFKKGRHESLLKLANGSYGISFTYFKEDKTTQVFNYELSRERLEALKRMCAKNEVEFTKKD